MTGSGMTLLGFEFSISCALSLNKAFTHSVPQLPHPIGTKKGREKEGRTFCPFITVELSR